MKDKINRKNLTGIDNEEVEPMRGPMVANTGD
ncbi:hypothetical protein BWQ96_06656 [Gracilariopsis chorda]|uniref:Uncharacterized protein n=1 Tax=Gracilariopsis chorda TaxID=448386 RepID=A0A2V3INH3_9FLOR|nr:hypothetical protein BWQ96_06656 [Gracilariopsis chorda]|eukprot:PXF43599.1 hypothetical protein BWQ96_06656 [Gracilariopsis chorda]